MGYDVHIAFAFPNDQQIRRRIESIAEALRSATVNPHGRLPYFEALGAGFFKKRVQTYRLLAYGYGLNEVPWPTVLFVDLIHRNDPDYDPNPDILKTRYGTRIQQYCVNIRNARPDDAVVARPLQSLPDQLRAYLQPVTLSDRSHMVYLSDEVMRAYQEFGTVERGDLITGIGDIINSGEVSLQELQERFSRNCGIIHERFLDPDTKYQHEIIWGAYSQTWPDAKKDKLRQRIQTLRNRFLLDYHKAVDSSARCDVLSRYANRAFPWYIMADSRLRDQVFEEREAFLALSTEESHLLEQTLVTAVLPLLIEGRAGSGKSTVLTYHVAERTAQLAWEHGDTQRRILFVTQSEKLLTDARRLIDQLIHRIVKEKSQGERTDQTGRQIAYLTYHEFALNQLPPERRSRFASRRRQTSGGWIDFSRFRDLMRSDVADGLRSPASKRIQPEAAWFVLRSYIKGYKIYETGDDRWLTPEEYVDTVPRGDRQVSLDLYEEVWKEIWPWYRRLTLEPEDRTGLPRYWDDLDLAWEVRHYRAEEAPTYAAVVCDEVQDLSRIELATLLEALEWFRYNLDEWEFGGQLKLPVIFAGDSHQTVNPASFRWQRVGADLTSAISFHVPRAKPVVTTSPLRCNYRNSPGIAKLANAIQKLRQEKLGAVGELQTIWRLPDPVPNQRVRFVLLDNASDSAGINELLDTGVLFIGPDDDDPSLQSAYPFWCRLGLTEIVPRENYVIPSEIKGLEQDFVAVFGFGTYFALLNLHDFWNWSPATLEQLSEDLWFRAEYFLNNLYVAVSRARDHLWIVETEEGWRAFWEPLRRYVETAVPDETAEYGCFWAAGSIAELIEISKANWPRLASSLQALAERDRDPDLAERAAFYYRLAGMPFDERRMLAFAYYWTGRVREAADHIAPIDHNTASDWWWEAQAWDKLVDPAITPQWRRTIAEIMNTLTTRQVTAFDKRSLICQLAELLQTLYKEILLDPRDRAIQSWIATVEQIIFTESVAQSVFASFPESVASFCRHLAERLIDCIPEKPRRDRWTGQLADIAFSLAEYHKAVSLWQRAGTTAHLKYYLAMARTTPYPACLQWLESAERTADIITLHENNPNISISRDDRRRVARAYHKHEQWVPCLTVWCSVDLDQVVQIWPKALPHLRTTNENLLQLVASMYDRFRREYIDDKTDKPDIRWSDMMLDLIYTTLLNEKNIQPEGSECQQLVHGFVFVAEGNSIARRLEGSWEHRQFENASWPHFQRVLRAVLYHAPHHIHRAAQAGDWDSAVNMAQTVFDLVWSGESSGDGENLGMPVGSSTARPSDSGGDGTRSRKRRFVLRPYIADKIDSRTSFVLTDLNYAWEYIQCFLDAISAGGTDWLSFGDMLNSEKVRSLSQNVDALSEQLTDDLRAIDVRELQQIGLDRLLALGALMEQARFRLRAVDYYRHLLRIAKDLIWPTHEILDRLEAAELRHEFWKSRATSPGAGPHERPGAEDILVAPGETKESALLQVRSLSSRAEAIVEFREEGYRVRVQATPSSGGVAQPIGDPELRIERSRSKGDVYEWHVRHATYGFVLRFHAAQRYLEVDGDRRFLVHFVRPVEGKSPPKQ
ncbi:MAG: hypothetical protein KatS3mg110_2830 [Pirellulaceae bacterium]|nr:MAG: hypothetical protein KatS3mg110_2830 [Pirellulaceae bacterium]